MNLYLLVPLDTIVFDDDEWECVSNESYLFSEPTNKYIEIELNPYCSETYGPDEVDFKFYWIGDSKLPYIEMMTNGPACIPVYLFVYDEIEKIYKEILNNCGA